MQSDDETFSDLLEMRADLSERYNFVKEACENTVIRWEWSSGYRYHLEPYWFERSQISRGRSLKQAPKNLEGAHEYGFDERGRVVVERQYSSFLDGRYDARFYIYEGDTSVTEVWYDFPPITSLKQIKRAQLGPNGPVHIHWLDPGFTIVINFEYEDGRVTRCISDKLLKRDPPCTDHDEYMFNYDENGLESIVRRNHYESYGLSGEGHVYRRPIKDAKAKKSAITDSLYNLLYSSVVSLIERFRSDHAGESCYAFVLTVTADGTYVEAAFGTEEGLTLCANKYEANGWVSKKGDIHSSLRTQLRWNPWDPFYFYSIDDQAQATGKGDGFQKQLDAAFEYNLFERYKGDTLKLCETVLRNIDAAGHFSQIQDRQKIAIGVAMGEDERLLHKTIARLNADPVVARVKEEIKSAHKEWLNRHVP